MVSLTFQTMVMDTRLLQLSRSLLSKVAYFCYKIRVRVRVRVRVRLGLCSKREEISAKTLRMHKQEKVLSNASQTARKRPKNEVLHSFGLNIELSPLVCLSKSLLIGILHEWT